MLPSEPEVDFVLEIGLSAPFSSLAETGSVLEICVSPFCRGKTLETNYSVTKKSA